MAKLLAYHNDKKIRTKYLSRVKLHYKMDEIISGTYWENGKGCAVGCTIHGNEHARYETELGIPQTLARLEDRIFEGLANKDSKEWPIEFLAAIKVGADLSDVWNQFAIWLLIDKDHGVINKANKQQTKEGINRVAELYQARCVDINEWKRARNANAAAAAADYADYAAAANAYAAAANAYAAAYAANDAANAYAANDAAVYYAAAAYAADAADAAADYAAAAAYAAAADYAAAAADYAAAANAANAYAAAANAAAANAYAASAYATRQNHYWAQSRKLLELLEAAPIGGDDAKP